MLLSPALIKATEQLNHGSVIVVEPSDNYRKTIQRYLANLKIKSMKFFETLEHAKSEIAINKASLLIVEWQQAGGQNGLQFCRDIRKDKRLRDTPFMLLSVESLRGDVVLASEVGIDGYMLKPFSFEDFCDQIVGLLRKSQERVHFTSLIEHADELLASGNLAEAEKTYLECEDYDAQSARIICGIGRIRSACAEEEEAISCFRSAIEANPTYLEAYRLVLEIYERQEQPHHTLHYALKAHDLSPDNPRYMLMIAKAYLMIGELTHSEAFFRKTIRISPSLAEGHKGLGDIHLLKEDYEQAMRCYEKALDLDHNDVAILNAIGLVYVKQKRVAEGIRQYQLALKVDAKNAKVLFNLGHAYENLEDLRTAKDFYNRALVEDPDYDKAQRGLQRVDKLLQQLKRAV